MIDADACLSKNNSDDECGESVGLQFFQDNTFEFDGPVVSVK
eukprot:SAG31_NODE_1189_length_9480_cov_19.686174_8_plen_42_part_00